MLIRKDTDQGYNCSLEEELNGARVIMRRKTTVIGVVEIGNIDLRPDEKWQNCGPALQLRRV